ncbi:MAG: response regulator [Rhodospirillaceae bacterium]|nr:response regulator [Rhodospirillaceae bacterium]
MEAYDLSHLNVLVAEDNLHMRFVIKTILKGMGIRALREAADGSDALKVLQTFPADVMISDWLMEPLDGLELTRMIRTASDSRNPYLPVILLTGYTEIARVKEARDAGITEFLAKPMSAQNIYHRLVQIIERPRGFIKATRFVGPDRRRHAARFEGADRRANAA